jgi:predicted kinase
VIVKLICMRGYAGAGKSTLAAKLAAETSGVMVNRDQLRMMLLGSWWTGKRADEDLVTAAEQTLVRSLLRAGSDVIVDDTNLNPRYLHDWADLAGTVGAEIHIVDVRTPVSECIARNAARVAAGQRGVDREVIERQARSWPIDRWPAVATLTK